MGKPTSGGAGGSGGRQRNASPESFREFANFNEQEEFERITRLAQGGLTNDEAEAMREYQDGDYRSINNALRKGIPSEKSIMFAGTLTGIVARSILKENIIVHRGWKDATPLIDALANGTIKGMVIDDEAFVSTTTDKQTVNNFSYNAYGATAPAARFRLRARAGLKAYSVPGAGESEFLFQRNSRIRITKAELVNGILLVEGDIEQ